MRNRDPARTLRVLELPVAASDGHADPAVPFQQPNESTAVSFHPVQYVS